FTPPQRETLMKRYALMFVGLLIVFVGMLYKLRENGFAGTLSAEDRRAVRAFEQRLAAKEGLDSWSLNLGGSTIAIDQTTGDVCRRNAAGKIEWSVPLVEGLRNWHGPSLLSDGRRIFVNRQYKGITALDAETGDVVWSVAVPVEGFCLSDDRLLL